MVDVQLQRWWLSGRWVQTLILVLLAAFSVAMFYPFIWLLLSSFKTGADIVKIPVTLLPEKWTLSAYQLVTNPERVNLGRAYLNSIIVAVGTVTTVLFTSSLGGFVFARLDFPGRNYLFYFILSTTMVPFLTLLIPLYIVMRELSLPSISTSSCRSPSRSYRCWRSLSSWAHSTPICGRW